MNRLPIALTILILAGGVCLGWRNHQHLSSARASHEKLVEEARAAGIRVDAAGNPEMLSSSSRRVRPDKETDAKSTAAGLIEFAREMEAKKKAGLEMNDAEAIGRVSEWMEQLARLDGAGMRALIAEISAAGLEDETRQGVIHLALGSMTETQPEVAMGILEDYPFFMNELTGSLLYSWAAKDPSAASAWYLKNMTRFSAIANETIKLTLIRGVAGKDPAKAFRLIDELAVSKPADTIASMVNGVRGGEDRSALLAALRGYLPSIADAGKRDELAKSAVVSIAGTALKEDFSSASRWIEGAGLSADEIEAFALTKIPSNSPAADTGKWVEWLGRSLPPEQSENAAYILLYNWATSDYRAAGEWLVSTPPGPVKDAATQSYAIAVAKYDPETAAQWAVALPEGNARKATLRKIHESWPRDVPGAEAFAEKHGIK